MRTFKHPIIIMTELQCYSYIIITIVVKMPGFYIASYPSTPYRFEVGYIELRDLMRDNDIVVHLYVENQLEEADRVIEEIIHYFSDYHDVTSLPGKILLSAPFHTIVTRVMSYVATKPWWRIW